MLCRDEILVLPKSYGTLDSEYDLGVTSGNSPFSTALSECRDVDSVHYLHFTANGKPWSHGARYIVQR